MGNISTEVDIHPPNPGECINFYSIAPNRYMSGVIKTMLNRSYKICSLPDTFNNEIDRLHKLFTNNNFPNKLITQEINKFKNKISQPAEPSETPQSKNINLYFRSQMSSQYKQEEGNLKRILDNNLTATVGNKLKVMIYYKNRKVRDLFVRNKPRVAEEDSHVVYSYTCDKGECQPPQKYIGYTTTTTKQRMTIHAQTGSILQHNVETHGERIRTADIMSSISIMYRSPELLELKLAEALLIKSENPTLNNQREGMTRVLKIF